MKHTFHLPRIFLIGIAPGLAVLLATLGIVSIPSNPLGWFLLLIGIGYAAGIVLLACIHRESLWAWGSDKSIVQEERGDRSFWLITFAMMVVFFLSPLEYLPFPAWLPRTPLIKFLGAGLVACGIVLIIWARRVLGAAYSGHVSVQQGQELVQSGPYRFLRHPAYAGYLMMAIGIGLGYSSLVGLVSVLVVLVPVLMVRIRVEERILAAHFDNQWQDYARSVPVLLPRLKWRK